MRAIIVWYNPSKESYYYRTVFYADKFYIGYKNQYNHEVILIIDIDVLTYHTHVSFRKRLIKRLLRFLEKINQKL